MGPHMLHQFNRSTRPGSHEMQISRKKLTAVSKPCGFHSSSAQLQSQRNEVVMPMVSRSFSAHLCVCQRRTDSQTSGLSPVCRKPRIREAAR